LRKSSEWFPVFWALIDNAAEPRESHSAKYDHFSHHRRLSSLVSSIQMAQKVKQETESETAILVLRHHFIRQMNSLANARTNARERSFEPGRLLHPIAIFRE
jgi:hypothetical protein